MRSIFGAMFVIAEIIVGEEKEEEGRAGFIGIGAVVNTLPLPDLLYRHVRSLYFFEFMIGY